MEVHALWSQNHSGMLRGDRCHPVRALLLSDSPGAAERPTVLACIDSPGADILLPASIILDQAIRDAFLAGANREIEFFSEDLDALRLPGAGFETALVEYLRKKYEHRTPDIVIAVYAPALELARQHRPELWPDAPLVFCCVPDDLIRRRYLGPRTTGVCDDGDVFGIRVDRWKVVFLEQLHEGIDVWRLGFENSEHQKYSTCWPTRSNVATRRCFTTSGSYTTFTCNMGPTP